MKHELSKERLTDEELSQIAFYAGEAICHPDPNYALEFEKLAHPANVLALANEVVASRALLAAHEQEPVAYKATHLDSFAFGETKSAVEEHADRFGWELEFTEITPLYTHPSPVPAVPDYYVVVTSANVWQTFCKTRAEADFIVSKLFHKGYYVLEVYTRRAAMLNGEKS